MIMADTIVHQCIKLIGHFHQSKQNWLQPKYSLFIFLLLPLISFQVQSQTNAVEKTLQKSDYFVQRQLLRVASYRPDSHLNPCGIDSKQVIPLSKTIQRFDFFTIKNRLIQKLIPIKKQTRFLWNQMVKSK